MDTCGANPDSVNLWVMHKEGEAKKTMVSSTTQVGEITKTSRGVEIRLKFKVRISTNLSATLKDIKDKFKENNLNHNLVISG